MIRLPDEEFDALVDSALEQLPEELLAAIDNVAIFVEDEGDEPELFGLYEGIPLTERDDYGGFAMPDRITIYRHPILHACRTKHEVVDEVRITVIHELAHHFGIDDDRLDELGWA